MLTLAISDLQAPSKFSELSMGSVQAHFKKIKYHKKWANQLRFPATPFCACVECQRHGGGWRNTTHQIFASARQGNTCDKVVSIKVLLAHGFLSGSIADMVKLFAESVVIDIKLI